MPTQPRPGSPVTTLLLLLLAHGSAAHAGVYAADDGSGFTESSLATYSARVTWGNAFAVTPGCEWISAARVSFGRSVTPGRQIQIGLWHDPNADLDPRDATLVSLTTHTVTDPGGPETFADYAFTPVQVSGSFFIAVIADLAQGEPAMRMDFSTLGRSSWRFDNPIGMDNLDLATAGFGGRLSDFGLGTWMVRAVAVPAPAALALVPAALVPFTRRRRSPA
jgi:hypothetical protein